MFRLFSYNVLTEFNILGKSRKHGKTKTVFGKKRIFDATVVSFSYFASCLLKSAEAPALIKLEYAVRHCLMKFEFHDYLASFFNRGYFKVTST